MELKEEEKMLQVEETSGTEGLGAVSKPVTGTDQIITLDRLAASVYENDNETDDLNWHELQNSMVLNALNGTVYNTVYNVLKPYKFYAQAEDFDRHADLHGTALHWRGKNCECGFGRLPGLSCDDPGNRDEHHSVRTG